MNAGVPIRVRDMDSTDEIRRDATVATGFCITAAAGIVVALFLQMGDPSSTPFSELAQNSMIQQGGWWLILVALGIVLATTGRKSTGDRVVIFVLGLVVVGFAARLITVHGLLKFFPLDNSGNADMALPGFVAKPGIGVWVLGVGGALAVAGALLMPTQPKPPTVADADEAALRDDDELLAAWDGVEINPDELDPITRRALKRAGRI
jgi:hypothetical protein